jgi:hypothetical protein
MQAVGAYACMQRMRVVCLWHNATCAYGVSMGIRAYVDAMRTRPPHASDVCSATSPLLTDFFCFFI